MEFEYKLTCPIDVLDSAFPCRNKENGEMRLYVLYSLLGLALILLLSLGVGFVFSLDEKAIEAVRNWKFEPAMKDGHPVRVEIAVEVDFHLY